jgi:hypothetical protein
VAETLGSERPLEIVLGRGATVELTVVDDLRRVVRGARVVVTTPEGIPVHARAWSTGPGGRVRIAGVPAGGAWVSVSARGYGRPPAVRLDLADGEVAPVVVTLRPAGAVRVVLTRRDRAPLPRARIDLLRAGSGELVDSRRPVTRPEGWLDFPYTPRSGIALFEDLEEGSYELVVDAGTRYGVHRIPVRVRSRLLTEVPVLLESR